MKPTTEHAEHTDPATPAPVIDGKQILIDSYCRDARNQSISGGVGFAGGTALLLLGKKSDIPVLVPLLFFVAIIAAIPLALQCLYARRLDRLRHLLENPDRIAWVFRGPNPPSCRDLAPWPWRLFWEKIPVGTHQFEIRSKDGGGVVVSVPRDQADAVAAWLRDLAPSAFASQS